MACLSDLFTLQMGKTPARGNANYWNDGANSWVSIADITKCTDMYIGHTAETISDLGVRESGIKIVPPGTVIMSFKLTIGKTAITSKPMFTNEAIMAFLPKKGVKVVTEYLYWALMAKDWSKVGNRAVMGVTVNKAVLSQVDLALPDEDEQKRIASHLSKVETLIIKQEKKLLCLDRLIKSQFVAWQSDWIDFVKEEPLEKYLDLITYGFTSPMPDSSGGPWKFTAKDIVNSRLNFESARKTTQDAFDSLTSKCKPQLGDVLLTKDGTLGRTALVEDSFEFCINQSVALLRPNSFVIPQFLENLLQQPQYQKEMIRNAGGVTIKHLYISRVSKMPVRIPDLDKQRSWCDWIQKVNKSKFAVEGSIRKLELLKKSLMQKYFG